MKDDGNGTWAITDWLYRSHANRMETNCSIRGKAMRIVTRFLFLGIAILNLIPAQAKETVKTDFTVCPLPNPPGAVKLDDRIPRTIIQDSRNDPETRAWMALHSRSIISRSSKSLWTTGVVCKLTIGSDGSVKHLKVQKSCNDKSKDQRALTLLRNAAPYYPLPSFMKEQTMLVELLDFPRFKLTACH